jgi:hypothetical protein
MRWMDKEKSLQDEWRRGRLYEVDGGEKTLRELYEKNGREKDFTRTLRDEWRKGRLYGMNEKEEDFTK